MQSTANTVRKRERSFPLIAMIQLLTFCIALLVCVDGSKLNERLVSIQNDIAAFLFTLALAGTFGSLIGAWIGFGQIRNWRGMCFCGAIGSVVGVLLLAIYVAPAKPAQAISAALLPLVTTLAVRFRSP